MKKVRGRLRKTPIGLAIVIGFFVLGLVGPWVAPYDPLAIDLLHEYEPPSWTHLLGTGDNGIDILSALLHGARLAAIVGIVVVGVSVVLGTLVGTWAGYAGRVADHVITGIADLVQAFPAIVLNIAVLALVSRPGLMHLIVALAVNGWVLYTCSVRSSFRRPPAWAW
jgi:peptide/nickel transport system permease protein